MIRKNSLKRMAMGSLLTSVCSLCLLLLFFHVAEGWSATPGVEEGSLGKATIVWVEDTGTGYELFYSFFEKGKWSKATQLTFSNSTNYIPTLLNDRKKNTWIVWSAVTQSGVQLYYAIIHNGRVLQKPKLIETGMFSNVGPYLAMSAKGQDKPLLVWAGNTGQTDDIFYTHWDGKKWITPIRVNSPNSYPDYLPEIIFDQQEGLTVEWSSVGPEGEFVNQKKLGSFSVKREKRSGKAKTARLAKSQAIQKCINVLPSGIRNLERSSMVFSCEGDEHTQQVMALGDYIYKKFEK